MRKFNDMSPITMCFGQKTNPMMKIDTDRNITVYNSVKEKLSALNNKQKNDKFIIAWGGQWSTDVFEISEEDIETVTTVYTT